MLSRAIIFRGPTKSLVSLGLRCAASAPASATGSSNALYQRPVRQEAPKIRLGIFPEEWFTFFYKKTGVTGPYTFGVGLLTYLFSKEWIVWGHDFDGAVISVAVYIVLVKKFGPQLGNYLDKEIDAYENELSASRNMQKEELSDDIEMEKKMQWSIEGQQALAEAKREIVDFQLEANYRYRLKQVYDSVLQRLNYQAAKEAAERRIAQKHLVSWVIKQVLGSITADQENKNIDKCIADLAVLAKS